MTTERRAGSAESERAGKAEPMIPMSGGDEELSGKRRRSCPCGGSGGAVNEAAVNEAEVNEAEVNEAEVNEAEDEQNRTLTTEEW